MRDAHSHRALGLLVVVVLMVFSSVALAESSAEPAPEDVLALRIVADPREDAELVEAANEQEGRVVRREGQRVAEWVPLAERMRETIEEEETQEGLALRSEPGGAGGKQLLVRTEADDIVASDLDRVNPTVDFEGKPAIAFSLVEEAGERFGRQTQSHIGRRLAIVIEEQVHTIPTIHNRISLRGVITGFDSDAEVKAAIRTLEPYAKTGPGPIPAGELIMLLVVAVVVFLPLIVLAVVAAWPTSGFRPSPAPRAYTIAGGTLGFIGGAYWLGVTRATGPGPSAGNAISIETTYQVELLYVGLGGFLGCFVGILLFRALRYVLLRAFHNAQRLAGRVDSSL